VEDVGKSIPRIYVALDNKQVDNQSTMIKVNGMIFEVPISIFIPTHIFLYKNFTLHDCSIYIMSLSQTHITFSRFFSFIKRIQVE